MALDEALLEEAEAAAGPTETLRFWEPAQYMAVVGRSSRVDAEVYQDVCRELGIPILRRISGGAAILAGPGCLMYSLVLGYENRPKLRTINSAHSFVLGKMADALNSILPSPGTERSLVGRGTQRVPGGEGVHFCGTSDLAIGHKKFSGNSMRCRKRHFLYHGTILYDFPLEKISRCLKNPPRMPEYRNGRDHNSFITNLPVPRDEIKRAMISAWKAEEETTVWPRELTARLAAEKYGNPQWNE